MSLTQLTTPAPYVSLTEAKDFLRKTVTASIDDGNLQFMIDAAHEMIRDRIGEVAEVDYEEDVLFCNGKAVVTKRPVVSVVTYELASQEGVIKGDVDGVVQVTYTAGRTPIPGNIKDAALELVAHLWRSSQHNQTRPLTGTSDQPIFPQTNWALPIRVRELLGLGKNYRDMPFVAREIN